MIETFEELTPAAHQARLRCRNADLRHQRDLGELMTKHVVQEYGFGVGRLHLGELKSQAFEFRSRGRFPFDIDTGANWLGFDARLAVEHAALTAARAERVEAHVARDARGPGAEAACARIRASRKRHHDLLEGCLHEIVVIDLTPTKHAVKSVIHNANQTLVDHRRDLMIAALYGFDQFLVGRRPVPRWSDARRRRRRGTGGNDS